MDALVVLVNVDLHWLLLANDATSTGACENYMVCEGFTEQGTCARSSRDVTNISLLFPYTSLSATGVRVILFTVVRLSKIMLGIGIPERLMHKETL